MYKKATNKLHFKVGIMMEKIRNKHIINNVFRLCYSLWVFSELRNEINRPYILLIQHSIEPVAHPYILFYLDPRFYLQNLYFCEN